MAAIPTTGFAVGYAVPLYYLNFRTMKIKITDRSGQSVYTEFVEDHLVETIRTAAYGIDSNGDKQLYFIAEKDADLSLEIVHRICSAIVAVFGGSLVWDIVAELPESLCTEDGVAAYLFISQ